MASQSDLQLHGFAFRALISLGGFSAESSRAALRFRPGHCNFIGKLIITLVDTR